jgi:hypothetical protein
MKGLSPVDDIQYDRGQKIKMQLDQMVNTLNGMDVGLSLVWLWTWDLIRDKYDQYSKDDLDSDLTITDGTTLDTIWDKLWIKVPASFTLEYGAEYMDEAVTDWMIDNDFLVALDDDGWLDEDEDIVDLTADEETAMSEGLVSLDEIP